ncbi:MAG: hypothetical protein H7248_04265 [Microbacteriaceae bacterium]|nr:hypothetical protein [Microbacteriaceae bacterium]
MTDLTLRLPTTTFRAVVNLGRKRAADIRLPARFAEPLLFGDYDEEDSTSGVYVGFDDGQLHLETSAAGVTHHFHAENDDDDDGGTETSPWPAADTTALLTWAYLLAEDFHALTPDILHDVDDAAAWHDSGFDLFVCEVEEPAQLDLVETDIEGELMMLPWLGAGQVSNDHIEGANHPIALLWHPLQEEPNEAIAEAWLDPATSAPASRALPGVDWAAVGMTEAETLAWLEGIYLNHHVIPDPAGMILTAVLERLGGLS